MIANTFFEPNTLSKRPKRATNAKCSNRKINKLANRLVGLFKGGVVAKWLEKVFSSFQVERSFTTYRNTAKCIVFAKYSYILNFAKQFDSHRFRVQLFSSLCCGCYCCFAAAATPKTRTTTETPNRRWKEREDAHSPALLSLLAASRHSPRHHAPHFLRLSFALALTSPQQRAPPPSIVKFTHLLSLSCKTY